METRDQIIARLRRSQPWAKVGFADMDALGIARIDNLTVEQCLKMVTPSPDQVDPIVFESFEQGILARDGAMGEVLCYATWTIQGWQLWLNSKVGFVPTHTYVAKGRADTGQIRNALAPFARRIKNGDIKGL